MHVRNKEQFEMEFQFILTVHPQTKSKGHIPEETLFQPYSQAVVYPWLCGGQSRHDTQLVNAATLGFLSCLLGITKCRLL